MSLGNCSLVPLSVEERFVMGLGGAGLGLVAGAGQAALAGALLSGWEYRSNAGVSLGWLAAADAAFAVSFVGTIVSSFLQ